MKTSNYMFKRCQPLGLGLLTLALMAGCGGTRTNDPVEASEENLSLALTQVIDNSVVQAVVNFNNKSESFLQSVDAFCLLPDESTLQDLQSQWQGLFDQWYQLSNYNFGPLNDDLVFPLYTFIDSYRLRGTNYTETVITDLSEDIAGTQELDQTYYASRTFQFVGLLPLEVLSFTTLGAERSSEPVSVVSEYQASPRKCDALTGLAELLATQAQSIQVSWQQDYQESGSAYRDLFLAGETEDGSEPITLLIASVQGFLDYLQARNVVVTVANFSGSSWQAVTATIDEVEMLLTGTEQSTISIFDIMESTGNSGAVATVQATITAVRAAIEGEDETLLEVRLGELDGHFKREIPDSLNVELGISFSDGD